MKKQSVDAKIVIHLDPSDIRMDDLTLNILSYSSFTCLVFFSDSEDIVRSYLQSLSPSAGTKVHVTLTEMIDSNSSSLFGLQVFHTNPMILASEIEEALNRPNYFSQYVLHIVPTKEPIQSFLNICDLSVWKKRFLSEVKKKLISPSSQMHGLIPSIQNPVTPLYDLKKDTAFLCIIALHRYLNRSTGPEHHEVNFVNLLLQLNKEKDPDQLCTQEYSELCINYAHYLNRTAKDLEDFYKLSYAKTSNRLLEIILKRYKSLEKTNLTASCVDLALANKAILSKTIPPHEHLQKLITETERILGNFHDATEIDFTRSEELLNKAQTILESGTDKIPTHLIKGLQDAYQLARFKFYFKKTMVHKKNNFQLDAWVALRTALSFLLSSSESQNVRYLAVVHHHMGLLKNLIEDESCNEHLIEAMMYYEQAEMIESVQKVKAILLRIEFNKSLKENPDDEKECCFQFWKSAIEKGDMAKLSYIHGYLKKNSQRIQVDDFKKLIMDNN